jgi:Ala-tRNA(Pro) deacylase
MTDAEKVYQVLDTLGIDYEKYEHPPVMTIADIEKLDFTMEPMHCKNLFLRNEKGNQHYLALVHHNKKANTRGIAKKIGSTRLSFASDKRLKTHLGLEPGGVSVFGLIHNEDRKVIVLVDEDLRKEEKLTFHPNVNTASVIISQEGLKKFLDYAGHPVRYITMD